METVTPGRPDAAFAVFKISRYGLITVRQFVSARSYRSSVPARKVVTGLEGTR
jgi:hypothetical protein